MVDLVGCDFSSSPSRRKCIVIAVGTLSGERVQLSKLERLSDLETFASWLQQPRDWIGGFDLPFGLPRELVKSLGWPVQWEACVRHFASLDRASIRAAFSQFCNSRPVGSKFAHRATDALAGSSPSMKWVNPPVTFMLHAGLPRLLDAGIYLPGLMPPPVEHPDRAGLRVGVEAYPAMLAREVLARRSYKSDDRSRQTADRLIARKDLLTSLELGHTRLHLRLALTNALRDVLLEDGSADSLDAVLCMMQAGWAAVQHAQGHTCYGLPQEMDSLEGWIVSA